MPATRTSPYTITPEMVDDILTAAMEGGVDYWTRSVRVIGDVPASVKSTLFPGDEPFTSEMLTKGFDLRWVDDEGKAHVLTLRKMKAGIKKASEHFRQTPAVFHEDHDATSGDVAVQFALFGEVVYG